MTGSLCFRRIERRNGSMIPGNTVRIDKGFGDMPIMTMSNTCHLAGLRPVELVKLREEVSQ
jgi:hypothetical protein